MLVLISPKSYKILCRYASIGRFFDCLNRELNYSKNPDLIRFTELKQPFDQINFGCKDFYFKTGFTEVANFVSIHVEESNTIKIAEFTELRKCLGNIINLFYDVHGGDHNLFESEEYLEDILLEVFVDVQESCIKATK